MTQPAVVSDPKVMLGKPVIAGTRITVELLLEKLAAGESVDQIHQAHPHLPAGSVPAALAYALAVLRNETVVPLERQSA
ncbi:MAG: DUF433 domain-containing protein [Gemmataceae bacterium]